MSKDPSFLFLFVVLTLILASGYFFLTWIWWRIHMRNPRRRFLACGWTALAGISHLYFITQAIDPEQSVQNLLTSVWLLGVEIPQAALMWWFLIKSYIEVGDFRRLARRIDPRPGDEVDPADTEKRG